MDYKEKYNKLVEAIKILQKVNPSDKGIQNWIKDNVPELTDSNEEKIRKEILDYFSQFDNNELRGVDISNWIAWLEIQEQKSIWNEEDDSIVESILFWLKSVLNKGCYPRYEHWFKLLKQRHTWKPSDEQITWLYRATDEAKKDSRMKQVLNELLYDLKKLKAERYENNVVESNKMSDYENIKDELISLVRLDGWHPMVWTQERKDKLINWLEKK